MIDKTISLTLWTTAEGIEGITGGSSEIYSQIRDYKLDGSRGMWFRYKLIGVSFGGILPKNVYLHANTGMYTFNKPFRNFSKITEEDHGNSKSD